MIINHIESSIDGPFFHSYVKERWKGNSSRCLTLTKKSGESHGGSLEQFLAASELQVRHKLTGKEYAVKVQLTSEGR